MCMYLVVSFSFADMMRIIWIMISLAPMGALMTRREARGDGDDIGKRGELSRMTEEDRHRLQNQTREELRAILLRAGLRTDLAKACSVSDTAFVFFRGGKAVDKCSDEMALQVKLAKATRVVKRREAWGAGLLARD